MNRVYGYTIASHRCKGERIWAHVLHRLCFGFAIEPVIGTYSVPFIPRNPMAWKLMPISYAHTSKTILKYPKISKTKDVHMLSAIMLSFRSVSTFVEYNQKYERNVRCENKTANAKQILIIYSQMHKCTAHTMNSLLFIIICWQPKT